MCTLALVVVSNQVCGQDVDNSDEYETNTQMEELVVEGQVPDISDLNKIEVLDYYNANATGGALYKMRRYDEAKPLLEVGAKLGFKMSQARLGAIYLHGLGTTEQDVEKGMIWLGVAAEPRTDPEILKTYKQYANKLPDDMRDRLDRLVAEQSSKYGTNASGTKCRMIRIVGSHMAELSCEVEDIYKFRSSADNQNLCLMGGFDRIQSEAGGEMGLAAISVVPCI